MKKIFFITIFISTVFLSNSIGIVIKDIIKKGTNNLNVEYSIDGEKWIKAEKGMSIPIEACISIPKNYKISINYNKEDYILEGEQQIFIQDVIDEKIFRKNLETDKIHDLGATKSTEDNEKENDSEEMKKMEMELRMKYLEEMKKNDK